MCSVLAFHLPPNMEFYDPLWSSNPNFWNQQFRLLQPHICYQSKYTFNLLQHLLYAPSIKQVFIISANLNKLFVLIHFFYVYTVCVSKCQSSQKCVHVCLKGEVWLKTNPWQKSWRIFFSLFNFVCLKDSQSCHKNIDFISQLSGIKKTSTTKKGISLVEGGKNVK